ncbi:hypothetical protein SCHPADRAFT_905840 [Schizopora paradoxa]|uniref:MYND-type domain-containing protein n=1 Tax=Schizopora paradoxa TaxID=27342 RepID=A0A0H2RQC0_9AGAM|nr:hypothetical protein SCHPADRAFT_905840 [Schizopora paradoxa]
MFIDQAQTSLNNYHFLCAALQERYQVRYLQYPEVKYLLDFSPYTAHRPELPKWVCELRRRPSVDGMVDAAELKKLHDMIKRRPCHYGTEGLLGYVFNGDRGGFFDVILAYNGPGATCGNKKWDRIFDRMKAQGYKQSLVPCMFFASRQGCLVDNCPYSHTDKTNQELRAKILEERRQILLEPTAKQELRDFERRMVEEGLDESQLKCFKYQRTAKDYHVDRPVCQHDSDATAPRAYGYCANLDCVKPYLFTQAQSPLQQCSGCEWTYYCSEACHMKDWPRHRLECAPVEEVISNNKLWSTWGTRLGTEIVLRP